VNMSFAAQFQTFPEMIQVMATNCPHALVQDWWARLESQIRAAQFGQRSSAPVHSLIESLSQFGLCKQDTDELHGMRKLRNRCAHGEAPSISPETAAFFALRAWSIAWSIASKQEEMSPLRACST
jgi:hypothetical protein